jgi:hypothetical protein
VTASQVRETQDAADAAIAVPVAVEVAAPHDPPAAG